MGKLCDSLASEEAIAIMNDPVERLNIRESDRVTKSTYLEFGKVWFWLLKLVTGFSKVQCQSDCFIERREGCFKPYILDKAIEHKANA